MHSHHHPTPPALALPSSSSPSHSHFNFKPLPYLNHHHSSSTPVPSNHSSRSTSASPCTSPDTLPSSSSSSSYLDTFHHTPKPAAHYPHILPRNDILYKKRCETCTATHDGSFGAGRFCSSRCARTVGGLAHRKKRLIERDAKQRYTSSGTSNTSSEIVKVHKKRHYHHNHLGTSSHRYFLQDSNFSSPSVVQQQQPQYSIHPTSPPSCAPPLSLCANNDRRQLYNHRQSPSSPVNVHPIDTPRHTPMPTFSVISIHSLLNPAES